jgi:hypothetical protein
VTEKELNESRDEYRKTLLDYARESQNSYDKTLITLSGGALGISFAFIERIIGDDPMVAPCLLAVAWISWTISLTFVLFSFYTSHWALSRAIKQVDKNEPVSATPGGFPDWLTSLLNALSGLLFVAGVGAMIWFVMQNL